MSEPDQIAEYVCVGGPLDGERHTCEGRYLIVPVMTTEYTRQYHEWQEKHGVAWAVENLDAIREFPLTPRPPRIPQERYELAMGDAFEPYLRHIDGSEGGSDV